MGDYSGFVQAAYEEYLDEQWSRAEPTDPRCAVCGDVAELVVSRSLPGMPDVVSGRCEWHASHLRLTARANLDGSWRVIRDGL